MSEERDRSPEGRFKYVAKRRMDKALKAIDSLSSLADRKNYRYEAVQVEQMLVSLESAVDSVRQEFARNLENKPKEFNFE